MVLSSDEETEESVSVKREKHQTKNSEKDKNSDPVQQNKFKDTFGIVKCTICREQVNPFFGNSLMSHPSLHVVVCKDCNKFYNKGGWTYDEEGKDEQCHWCGQGGDIVICDVCPHGFCKNCIKKHAGRTYLDNLEAEIESGNDSEWRCFACDSTPIEHLQRIYQEMVLFVNNVRKSADISKRKFSLGKQNLCPQPIFSNTESLKASEGSQNLQDVCKKVLNFTKTAVVAFESIHETAIDDGENFRDSKKHNKKIVDSLRSAIDSLTDGLLWATEHLDRIDPIEEKPKKSKRASKINLSMVAANADTSNTDKSFGTKSKSIDVKEKIVMVKEKSKVTEKKPLESESERKPNRKCFKAEAKSSTSNNTVLVKKSDADTSTIANNSVDNSAFDERKILLDALGINSDDETTGTDCVAEEHGSCSSKFDDAMTEELSDIEQANKPKRAYKITKPLESDRKDESRSNRTISNSNIIPDSDLSSVDISDNDSLSMSDSSSSKRKTTRKYGGGDRSEKKKAENATEKKKKVESDDDIGMDLEKTLKDLKNFRLNKLLSSVTVKTKEPTPKKHKLSNGESSNGPKKSESTSPIIEDSDSDAIEEKDEKSASPDLVAEDTTTYVEEKNERDVCLATLGVDSDASATLSDQDNDDISPASKKNKTKKDGKKKLFDDENFEIISVSCDDKNGLDNDEEIKKCRSTMSKTVEKLLKTKITAALDDTKTKSSRAKADAKPKNKKSKKNTAKILSSDEEENGKDASESEITDDSLFDADDGDNDKLSEARDSNTDDDFEDKPSTSRRRPATRRTARMNGNAKNGKNKKGRKRVAVSTDEENDGSGDEDLSPNKSGRKKIRGLIGKDDLAPETIDAYEAEKERRKRIVEKQKLYNVVAEEDPNAKVKKFKLLVLEKDPKTDATLVEVHRKLVEKLKPHQVAGIQFLYENTIESVEKSSQPGQGCVLAHCMGLGKTLQVVGYLHTILTNERLKFKTALVIAPLNVVLNWQHEFSLWLEDELAIDVYEMSSIKQNADRAKLCDTWQEDGGVLIISYSLYLKLATSGKEIKKEKWRQSFKRAFLDPGPDVVVCDEGHILKNEKTGISKIINQIRTKRRICLTGTPLQNNLKEYYTMVQFVKPNLLGSKTEFANRFANPIKNGQYVDSTPQDVACMKRRAHILHKTLDGCVNRQDYTALAEALPPKHEYVVYVSMTDCQIKLYRLYLKEIVGLDSGTDNTEQLKARRALFADFQAFQRIWTHPYGLILHQREMERRDLKEEEKNFVDDDDEEEESDSECSRLSSSGDDRRKRKKRKIAKENDENQAAKGDVADDDDDEIEIIKTYSTRRNPAAGDAPLTSRPTTPLESRGWFKDAVTEEDRTNVNIAGKFVLLFEILRKCEAIGDKVLVFSQSLIALDIIEIFLEHYQKTGWAAHPDSLASLYKWGWKEELDYFRLDGSTSAENRRKYSKKFNDSNNLRARLFLISTKAGSLGMNLFGANRVIVFDASWNPTHDIQSMFRVYRFGQTKPVYIYRFISQGTMEETIYDRGVTKQSLACRVVDEQQIDRHFSDRDLQALYEFTPGTRRNTDKKKGVAGVPKDRLLADLMFEQKDRIFEYHEHDSLLQNLDSEQLTEEERQAAWNEYENERKNPYARMLPNRTTLPATTDRFTLFARAMPIIGVLINEGNSIITNSGENLDINVEQVARNWIENDPHIQRNPAELITKLQMLILSLRQVQINKVNSNLQRAAAATGANLTQQQNSIFPSFPK